MKKLLHGFSDGFVWFSNEKQEDLFNSAHKSNLYHIGGICGLAITVIGGVMIFAGILYCVGLVG